MKRQFIPEPDRKYEFLAQIGSKAPRNRLLTYVFARMGLPAQSPYQLTLLKRLSQSTRPTKIRERLVDLGVMKELYAKVAPILSVLNLGSEGIRYFAGSVARMRTTNMRRRADEDIHVHLVAFIAHQYYRLHDNLTTCEPPSHNL